MRRRQATSYVFVGEGNNGSCMDTSSNLGFLCSFCYYFRHADILIILFQRSQAQILRMSEKRADLAVPVWPVALNLYYGNGRMGIGTVWMVIF